MGCFLGVGVFFGFQIAIEILSRPFLSLSPLAVLGGVAVGLLSLAGAFAAFLLAFGKAEGETREQAKLSKQSLRVLEILEDESRRQAWFTIGRTVGRFIGKVFKRNSSGKS